MIDTAFAGSRTLSDQDISRAPSSGALSPWNSGTLSDREIQLQISEERPFELPAISRSLAVRRRLQQLLGLSPDWDSYGARAIEPAIVAAAQHLLSSIARSEIELPSVVPTSSGGLSLEWHRPTLEFTIELEPESGTRQPRAVAFFSDDVSGEQWERSLLELEPTQLQGTLSRFH